MRFLAEALRVPCVVTLALLAACSAPDYSAVRDWGATASIATDYPPIAPAIPPAIPPATAPGSANPAPQPASLPAGASDAALAMQQVLVTYLAALSTVAADGVLPYLEDPFTAQASRAAGNAEASLAIATLGAQMRHASRTNRRAPALRYVIAEADPSVQVLATALSREVSGFAGDDAERAAIAAQYAALAARARDASARRAIQDMAALRDQDFQRRAEARRAYAGILAQVAAGHALLAERSRHLSQEETARQVRAAESRLRRAIYLLPRSVPPTDLAPARP